MERGREFTDFRNGSLWYLSLRLYCGFTPVFMSTKLDDFRIYRERMNGRILAVDHLVIPYMRNAVEAMDMLIAEQNQIS